MISMGPWLASAMRAAEAAKGADWKTSTKAASRNELSAAGAWEGLAVAGASAEVDVAVSEKGARAEVGVPVWDDEVADGADGAFEVASAGWKKRTCTAVDRRVELLDEIPDATRRGAVQEGRERREEAD